MAIRIAACTAASLAVAVVVIMVAIDFELFDNESIFGF